jgi:hypothetical protein
MAKISGTYVTSEAKGLRENLTDKIYQISPEKVPFTSMVGKGSSEAILHEWQVDELAAPNLSNKQPEGNEAAFTSPTPTVRLGNYHQISSETAIVSGTLEEVKKAGRKSEMAYQLAKRAPELKRTIESILLSNQGADSADPRAVGSLLAFIKTNTSLGATGTDPVYTNIPTDPRNDGTQRVFTEDMLKDVQSQAWNEGGDPSVVMTGSFNKAKISTFAGNADKVINLNGAKPGVIVAAMDVYVGDLGTVKVVPNRWQRARDVLVLDPSMIQINYLRGYRTKKLAPTGDAEKRLLLAEYTLVVKNEKALGLVADLTTA